MSDQGIKVDQLKLSMLALACDTFGDQVDSDTCLEIANSFYEFVTVPEEAAAPVVSSEQGVLKFPTRKGNPEKNE